MSYKEMTRRLDELERQHDADGDGAFVIDVGIGYVDWQGQRIPTDEWQRRYPDAVFVDIGGTLNENTHA
jgi:hypothetical protein